MTLEEEIGRRNVRATHFPLNIFANFPLVKQTRTGLNRHCTQTTTVRHQCKPSITTRTVYRKCLHFLSGFLSSPLDYRVGRLTALFGLSSLQVWYFDVHCPM